MKFFLRLVSICSRIALVAMAIILIFTIAPHQMPWTMLNVFRVLVGAEQMVFINLALINQGVLFREFQLLGMLIVTILVLILLSPSAREAILAVFRSKFVVSDVLLSLGAFLFTLIPASSTSIRADSWPAMFYLIWASLSMILLLWGIYPLANAISRWQSGRYMILFIWEKAKELFLNSKAPLFLGSLFIIVFTLTNLASYFLFEHIPHVIDSIAQVFHGKVFAEGKLTVSSHVYREFFDLKMENGFTTMINNGKWYSQYPPGHALMLMLGILLDAPWIVNPLLGSLTIILLYFLGAELYDKTVARLSAVLGTLSPFVLFMSSEFMNHASTLFFFTSFLLFFAKTIRSGKIVYAIAAGSSLGMVLNIRPLTAVGLAIPFCIYGGYLLVTRFHELRLPMTAVVIMVLVFAGILLGFNALTNGNPLLFGYEALHGPEHRPGFGHAVVGEQHTPMKGLFKTLNNLNGVNKFLFEWPVPSLIFVFLLFASVTRNQWDYLLLSAFLSLTTVHFFYWYQDWCFGPRFLYESASALILLTARGIQRLPVHVKGICGFSVSTRKVHAATACFIAICVLVAAFNHIPPWIQYYGSNFENVNADVLKEVEKQRITKAVVFTRSYYGSVFTGNSPLLDGEIIYARDLGEKNRLLMSAYPGYKYYLADGSSIQLLEMK